MDVLFSLSKTPFAVCQSCLVCLFVVVVYEQKPIITDFVWLPHQPRNLRLSATTKWYDLSCRPRLLFQANSIEGCKRKDVNVVYTRWQNLEKKASYEAGQVRWTQINAVFFTTCFLVLRYDLCRASPAGTINNAAARRIEQNDYANGCNWMLDAFGCDAHEWNPTLLFAR